ncbi:Ig-like domain repeat protein [Nocardioides anomalus]|uniref:Ig-like domain repeat protein n=1 Tax=Nocardioides anomalus TaxID=2712223 RepID=A0A6G6WKH7_9ACTN|nr:Ig-like domain-containing protein [Nocardioides anomalus]QIG45570.1 Ig-like domain repeat protein [Nocardioides anomalus]
MKLLRRAALVVALPLALGAPVVLAGPAHAAGPTETTLSAPGTILYGQAVKAVATVTQAGQPVTVGNVEFRLNPPGGSPPGPVVATVALNAAGQATSPVLQTDDLTPLEVTQGSDFYSLRAIYMPPTSENMTSQSSQPIFVNKAPGSVAVLTGPSTITADVSGAAPSAEVPNAERATGQVTFTIDGVAQAPVQAVAGRATLNRTLAPGPHTLSATYAGDDHYTSGASGTESRTDPLLEARVLSTFPQKAGWYSAPVDVWVKCRPQGSELVEECPDVITLKKSGADQSVTVRVTAKDGGSATLTVSGIDIDRQKPKISVDGRTCTATDKLSGVKGKCHVKALGGGRYQATAKDRAGNVAIKNFRVD